MPLIAFRSDTETPVTLAIFTNVSPLRTTYVEPLAAFAFDTRLDVPLSLFCFIGITKAWLRLRALLLRWLAFFRD